MRVPVLLLALSLSTGAAQAQAPVSYRVAFPNAVHHEAEITVTFSDLPARPLQLRMSRTSPGRYALHEFAKNVYNVRAVDGQGRSLALTRPDPHQWDVAGHDGTVRVTYTLFGDRADGTYTGIDNTHAHLNAPATFLWARGLERRPVTVAFQPPRPEWRVATQLFPTRDPYTFTAPDFQYFMDSPVEISAHEVRSWEKSSGGRTQTIRLALHHRGTREEADAFTEMVKRVVDEQEAVFGELPRFDVGSYTFLADYLPWVAGDGMEHRNSTVLTSTRPLSTGALANLGTVSHEFFHAWNVERIRPRSLEPFSFEEANMSGELWFAEGFTSYYDDLFIRRAQIYDLDQYAEGLSGTLNGVLAAPGRGFFSPVEMSMQAPFVDAAVSIDPTNRANTYISYYTWGAALGLGLDLTLRTRFPGVTLDDYMRAMWTAYGKPEIPYTRADLRNTLGTVTGDRAFAEDFFRRYVEGREVVDYERLLGTAGLLLRRASPGRAFMGLALEYREGRAVVSAPPLVGTPAYRAGLERGDTVLSVDGRPLASAEDFTALMAARRPGEGVAVEWMQRGERRSERLTLAENPSFEVVTYEKAGLPVTDAMRAFRERWLGPKARPAPRVGR
jgi:predicted metalloprotease with PDZ domain